MSHTKSSSVESAIKTDADGDPIPPREVAGYRTDPETTTEAAVWSAPTRPETTFKGGYRVRRQNRVYVIVDDFRKIDEPVGIAVVEATEKPLLTPDHIIKTAGSAIEGVEKAISWMQEHPAPADPETIVDQMSIPKRLPYRDRDSNLDRIREGSTVRIDNLPVGSVTGKDPDNSSILNCKLEDGRTVNILRARKAKRRVYYSHPDLEEEPTFVEPSYIFVSNEDNLRDDVDQETYNQIKSFDTDQAIRHERDNTVEVIDIREIRDGAVNPSGGEVNPQRTSWYIDESEVGQWYECPFDLEGGAKGSKYRLTEEGLVKIGDRYAATVLVDRSKWADHDLPVPDEIPTRTNPGLSIVLSNDRPGLSPEDPVTNIIGIGSATADDMWHETVGELYEDGWPVPYVSGQYHGRAIADMFTLTESPDTTDAVRAIVGMFGGAMYNAQGDRNGCTANAVFGNLDLNNAHSGWIGHGHGVREKYCPSWSVAGKGAGGLPLMGAGKITPSDIEAALKQSNQAAEHCSEEGFVDPFAPSAILATVDGRDKMVALAGDDNERYIEIAKRPLEIAATVAGRDITDPDVLDAHVHCWSGKDHNGVVLIHGEQGRNVCLDSGDVITPEHIWADEE